jgi:hypothetical protein
LGELLKKTVKNACGEVGVGQLFLLEERKHFNPSGRAQ